MADYSAEAQRRIVFAISGASGMPLAREVLNNMRGLTGLEIHLVISRNAEKTMAAEGLERLDMPGHFNHAADNLGAPPASGSWQHDGMVICPCSMATLAAIACGFGSNLLHRAADVCLKERRPLILVVRESPLGLVHLRNMLVATESGAIIMPFMPAFYTTDNSLTAACRQFTGRILDLLHIPSGLCERWQGM